MLNPVEFFVDQLKSASEQPFQDLEQRMFAGVSFLFVKMDGSVTRQEFENYLQKAAEQFIEGTAWQYEYDYIRTSKTGHIYRFRFRVPDEKSFCCGNQCPNCILLR